MSYPKRPIGSFRDNSVPAGRRNRSAQEFATQQQSINADIDTRINQGTTFNALQAADWDGIPPTSISEALNRIARHLASGASGPVIKMP